MLKSKKLFALIMSSVIMGSVLLTGCATKKNIQSAVVTSDFKGKAPKYIFMFIGDGMSATQVTATEIYQGALKQTKTPELDKLNFTQFPAQGMKTTYAADSFIPDSASSGTAMASGHKTSDGIINMDPAKKEKYTSMAEKAKAKGMKVGIVSSVSIDHATPAVFYAHQASRNNYYDIALELGKSNFDYFGGGGFNQPTGKDKDKPDVYKEVEGNGYKITRTLEEFNKLDKNSGKVLAVNPVLDKSAAIPYAIDKTQGSLELKDFTKKGIEMLENDKGFFMMVEGGKVDWASHANDAATTMHDVLALEDSVEEALKFYEKHPEETLIVVTGDHETGGMTIGFAGTKYDTSYDKLANQKISFDEFDKKVAEYAKSHTAENAKIDDWFAQIKDNFGLITVSEDEKKSLAEKAKAGDKEASKKLGLVLTSYEISNLEEALKTSMIDAKSRPTDDRTYLLYGGYEPLTISIIHTLNQKAGIGWTSYAHTGVPIPVFAKGVGSELFTGYYDDTDTFNKFVSIMGLK